MARSVNGKRQATKLRLNKTDQPQLGESSSEVLGNGGSSIPAVGIERIELKEKTTEKDIEFDPIVIKDGKNKITISLTRTGKNNSRLYRLKIEANGHEIQPATYNGKSMASGYWSMLKGVLNK